MRPMTSTSAAFMSVPIAKVSRIWLPPALALPWISSTPARPCRTCSCGSSNSASTSSGEAPRQVVLMERVGRSTSGNNCKGSCFKLNVPNGHTSTTVTATAIGLRIAPSMRRIRALPESRTGALDRTRWSRFMRLRRSEAKSRSGEAMARVLRALLSGCARIGVPTMQRLIERPHVNSGVPRRACGGLYLERF